MLLRQWGRSVLHCSLAGTALWVALHHIHNAWGLVILAWCYVAGFLFLVNTLDLLTGGRLRRGKGRPIVEEQVIIRRIIVEEITPVHAARRQHVRT